MSELGARILGVLCELIGELFGWAGGGTLRSPSAANGCTTERNDPGDKEDKKPSSKEEGRSWGCILVKVVACFWEDAADWATDFLDTSLRDGELGR